MKIYTRTGDRGETALLGGGRVPKDHPRVRAYGAVDELNAFLGRAVAQVGDEASRDRLSRVQHDLFILGSHLASPPPLPGRRRPPLPSLPEARVREMEEWMDEADARLPPLRAFILPGGSAGAAELHLCRTVCRRAEREVVGILLAEAAAEAAPGEESPAPDPDAVFTMRYLNRLSDLLFVLARLENAVAGVPEIEWRKEADAEASNARGAGA